MSSAKIMLDYKRTQTCLNKIESGHNHHKLIRSLTWCTGVNTVTSCYNSFVTSHLIYFLSRWRDYLVLTNTQVPSNEMVFQYMTVLVLKGIIFFYLPTPGLL